jgi:hypothetical protein
MAVQILLSVCLTLCLFLLCWSAGALLMSRRCLNVSLENTLADACAATGLGFGIIANGVMVLCFFHCASPALLRWLSAILFAASVPYVWRNKNVIASLAVSFLRALRRSHPLVSAAFLLVFAGYFFRGLLPPTDFDGLMYHLASASLYLAHNGFYHIFFNPQSNFPMLTEMNFMLGLAWGNDIACKTMSFGLGAMALAVIAVACKRHCSDSRLAIGACLVFLTFTNTIANMSNCYVDIPQAVWTLLAVLVMERFCENNNRRYALCAALLAGMAMETKIFGVLVLPVLCVQILLSAKGRKKLWIDAATVFFPALLLALPWYAKSYLYSGTILSLHHATIVGQGLAHPMGVASRTPLAYWFTNIIGRVCTAPWTFTLFPNLHQSDAFGPLPLAVLPFLLFTGVPTGIRRLLAYAGTFLAGILFMEMVFVQGGASIRYCTFCMMLSSVLVVWTVSRLTLFPRIRRMLVFFTVVMVLGGMALFAKRYYREWEALAENMPRDAYYSSVLPEYPVIRAINALRDGATVMPVYNYSNYLINVPYVAAYRNYSSVEELHADFKKKNIRYIFANDKLDTAANRNAFAQITEKQCVASANGFYLFKVAW